MTRSRRGLSMYSISRRFFLTAASAASLAACASGAGTASNSTLGHVVVGNGPEPVLVLHEWLGDHANYDAVLPNLSPAAARYVFADLRGYGLSRDLAGSY